MRNIHTILDALEANARHLRRHAPVADRAIRSALSDIDGYPTSTSTSRERGGSELTAVEAAADRRIATVDRNTLQLRELLDQAEQLTYRLVVLVDRWLPAPERSTSDRCSGGGNLPGALEWGRPDCTNVGTSRRSGLCDACYMRWKRWERTGPEAA